MKIIILTLALFAVATALPQPQAVQDDADAYLSVPELITKYGYPAEEHFVNTYDGYILRMHRIPSSGPVVFLMHGLLSSSADWIISGPGKALAYLLADAGYDVWMGNARGNHYSRNHTWLSPDFGADFWHFSWHEIGIVDVPAMIDHALDITGQSQVIHIGHSQGTTTFYVMTAKLPEYNDKVKAHFSLAPIAYMNHMTSPLMHILAFWTGPLDVLSQLIGLNEFLPNNEFLALLGSVLCADGDLFQILCTNTLFAICGFSPNEMNSTMLPVLMGHTPAGSSVRQMGHYGQETLSGAFREYDFGVENLLYYGSLTPPNYELSNIKTPIHLFYSRNDWLSAEEDVLRFCQGIGSACAEMILVADGEFNHLDYMYGIRAPELVYQPLLEKLSSL